MGFGIPAHSIFTKLVFHGTYLFITGSWLPDRQICYVLFDGFCALISELGGRIASEWSSWGISEIIRFYWRCQKTGGEISCLDAILCTSGVGLRISNQNLVWQISRRICQFAFDPSAPSTAIVAIHLVIVVLLTSSIHPNAEIHSRSPALACRSWHSWFAVCNYPNQAA
jgi:hypothetical protein